MKSDDLLAVLDSVGPSASFCAEGSLPPVLPGLVVRGVGEIGVPVSAADAKRLVAKATQAPYGRGVETIVDTSVRRVWQLEPRQLSFTNPAWKGFVAGIVETVRNELGIAHDVRRELYKLLVYEKAGFFAPHRDTEKREGMFATLVVTLPSRHEGGTLVVTHDGERRRLELGGAEAAFRVRYAAFYADCQHEVLPVRRGYRVCLVYNLSTARKRQPAAPRSGPAVAKATQLLARIFEDPSRDRVAVALKHQYTEAALQPAALKGADRSRFAILAKAAEALGYELYLALLTRYQSGSADEGSVSYSRSRPRSRTWDDEEEEEGEADDFADIDEDSLTLDRWCDPTGRKVLLGEMRLEENEIVSDVAPGDWPSRTEVHEATGNEGVSMERWYRRAMVVLWPKDRAFRILAREGPWTAVPALERLLAGVRKPEEDARGRAFAEAIVERWPADGRSRRWDSGRPVSAARRMLKALGRIGSADLAGRFVRDVLPDELDGTEGPALVQLAGKVGWGRLVEPLRALFARQDPEGADRHLAEAVAVFAALCAGGRKATAERKAACSSLAGDVEGLLDRCARATSGPWQQPADARTGLFVGLFRAFAAIDDVERLDRLAARALGDARRYDLHGVLVPAVMALAGEVVGGSPARPAWARLHATCVEQLRDRTATRPEPPRDLARDASVRCSCADCRELNAFLADPRAEVHLFPRRKELRQHLHRRIEEFGCDVTHETVRKGSPQTFVCRKTQASYERRLSQYRVDLGLLRELDRIET